ncbi:serine hydrolase domain-containing protein [Neptunicella marina]|uniref:Beta-lactamase family protein n=1 Tax=Neptunicella marina TaxID=2125989 RepID=A0A8J6M442_9ALTE|nr:serine hydrolase domain-containing protein [Neptunicella marina]MBC3765816.1 beta-lactamase family protein [Neptunicella marina]
MKKFLGLFLSVFVFNLSAQGFDSAKLDKYLNALEANNKAMLSLSIVEHGKTVYQHAIGFADVASQQQADKNTQYRIGSITKVFTATMIFQLIDEGKLTLDTKLSTFFPQIKNADDISISMLLSHRSGIQNFTDAPDYQLYMTQPKTRAEMLNIIKRQGSDFAPDSQYKYSNSGYLLLGYIIEDITQSSYASQLLKRICAKLDLTRTMYGEQIDVQNNQAKSYTYQASGWSERPSTDMSIPAGAGAIISTPTEVATFLYGLLTGKLISAESLTKMKEINQGVGRGLMTFPFYNKMAYGHNGGIDGFVSQSGYFEADDVALAMTANGSNYPLNDITIGVLSIYYGLPFDIPDLTRTAIQLPKEQLVKYQGVFASKQLPLKITLKLNGEQLTAQATGQNALPLSPFSSTEFRFDPAGIVIVFDGETDKVDYSSFQLKQGGGNYRFERE